jgi:LCP family protein required for cell wall assembly
MTPTHRSRRPTALVALLLSAWVAGTTLGATSRSQHAAAAGPLLQLEPAHADYIPTLNGTSPIFILFLGSDARPGETITGERSDSIHLVSINPALHKASILGFPRDSYVPIPGFGTNKINAAMTLGGPELVVKTVEALTGIKIDYWTLTWFDGFAKMIDDIGGLTVNVPFAMDDHYSHAFFDPGVQTLVGRDALAFARNRHGLPTGDFGRSEDQGLLLTSALAQFRKEFVKDPSRLLAWVGAGLRSTRTNVPLDQIMNLAFTCTTINPKHVENIVVPGTTATVGGLSIVNLTSDAQAIFNDLKDDGLVARKRLPPNPNASLLGG